MAYYPLQIDNFDHAANLYVHEQGDAMVSQTLRETGVWEAYETQLFLKALVGARYIVDVGANIGYYAIVAAKQLGGEGAVVAFEPEANNFALLDKNKQLNHADNLQVVNAGLAESDRQADIYLSDDNYGDHQIYDRGDDRPTSSIQLLHGSDFLEQKMPEVHVLKVDTQGAESAVFKGLDRLLKRSDNLTMIVEFWPFGLKKAGSHGNDLLDQLLSFGLPMFIIDHIGHSLIACTENDLRPWIKSLDEDPENEGFLNLLLSRSDKFTSEIQVKNNCNE